MKKTLSSIFAIALALVMELSLAACGAKYSTVKDLLNDADVQKELEGVTSSYEGSGMEVAVEADGDDTLLFTFTLDLAAMGVTEVTDEIVAAIAEPLKTSLDSDEIAETLKPLINDDLQPLIKKDLKITFLYNLSDGTELARKTFSGK